MNTLTFSTDKSLLDVGFIHAFITNSYWAKGRSMADVQTCIDNSFNMGVYLGDVQIGYARVVTDYVQFAYIMDLFIDPAQQGKGYAKQLVNYILTHEKLSRINVWRLATTDAHGLYAQFGFTPLAKPGNMMEKVNHPV